MVEPPTLISPVLATAMAHPLRVEIFTLLNEREATKKEIVGELRGSRSAISYHLGVLIELDCVEVVRAEPIGGGRAIQYVYKAADRAYFDIEGWEKLTPKEKNRIQDTLIRVISEDINEAMSSGTFYEPDDGHVTRSPLRLDDEGWVEIRDFLDESCLEGLYAIQERVDERCGADRRKTFPVKVAIMQFRSPEKRSKVNSGS